MSKIQKKLDIKQAIALCGYNNNIKNSFISFLQSNYNNNKNKLYLFERSKNVPKLFLLLLNIPTKYNNNSYDITILIYFPLNFPLAQPDIYFHKYCTIKINPNCLNYIDEDTLKINYNKFFKWENTFESFKNLIKEIYKQFNQNFPIFVFEDKNKNENLDKEEGDCILKEQCCKEIELRRPIINKNIQNNTKNVKTQINKNKNKIIDSFDKKNQQMNVKNIIRNNNNNNDIIDESILYDEDKAKNCLIKLLIFELYPKVNNINISVRNTKNNLEKMKNNIISEIKEFEEIETQRGNIEKSIQLMKNELKNFNIIESNKNIGENKKDFSNLDTLLNIKNKKIYILLSKEKTIEEYILILKKAFEKHLIDLANAMNCVREYTRQIFYIKYKYRNIKNINSNKI